MREGADDERGLDRSCSTEGSGTNCSNGSGKLDLSLIGRTRRTGENKGFRERKRGKERRGFEEEKATAFS